MKLNDTIKPKSEKKKKTQDKTHLCFQMLYPG